jgi:agmatinase
LYLVSTGRAEQEALQQRLYGKDPETGFREALERIARAKVIVLGIPSDVGAGFRRGANLGPQVIRSALYASVPRARFDELGVVDIGDVFVVPQLLSDDMLNDAQVVRTRAALYPGRSEPLPVSPLSIAERAMDLVLSINPGAAPLVLGGDHSTAWPAVAAFGKARKDRWGIVQPDAHTDLLEHRLGIHMCFATWSYHANELFGRDGRLVQVGTRASRYDRGQWETSLGVRQFWAEECRRDPEGTIERVVAHLRERDVTGVYFSNDIDGTDAAWADATGTPEAGGLEPDWVVALIRALARDVGILGGDIMEVAPPLRDDPSRTVDVAVRYVRETIGGIVGATV